jgi:hypothetical protein
VFLILPSSSLQDVSFTCICPYYLSFIISSFFLSFFYDVTSFTKKSATGQYTTASINELNHHLVCLKLLPFIYSYLRTIDIVTPSVVLRNLRESRSDTRVSCTPSNLLICTYLFRNQKLDFANPRVAGFNEILEYGKVCLLILIQEVEPSAHLTFACSSIQRNVLNAVCESVGVSHKSQHVYRSVL